MTEPGFHTCTKRCRTPGVQGSAVPKHRLGELVAHDTPQGWCRICLKETLNERGEKTKRTWHPECLDRWWLHAGKMREVVWKRDEGRCAKCGKEHRRHGLWAADHIKPLKERGSMEIDNLQTLCESPCHADKTRAEATARAAARRAHRAGAELPL